MSPAIIRLSKRYLIDDNAEHQFKILYNDVKNVLSSLKKSFGSTSWKDLDATNKSLISEMFSEYAEGTYIQLRKRWPTWHASFDSFQREVRVEGWNAKVIDFDNQFDNLLLEFSLVTETLTVVDSIGDFVIVSKGNMVKELNMGQLIKNLIKVEITDDYNFAEYSRINNPI